MGLLTPLQALVAEVIEYKEKGSRLGMGMSAGKSKRNINLQGP